MITETTSSLKAHRTAFLTQLGRFIPHAEERKRFGEVLDHFIRWSEKRSDVAPLEADYNAQVVSFVRTSDQAVVWTASPIRLDGARFEVMPRLRRSLTTEQMQDALDVFHSLSAEPPADQSMLRVRFGALKGPASRDRVTALLERLLVA